MGKPIRRVGTDRGVAVGEIALEITFDKRLLAPLGVAFG
jgi:hypothetical protein